MFRRPRSWDALALGFLIFAAGWGTSLLTTPVPTARADRSQAAANQPAVATRVYQTTLTPIESPGPLLADYP